MDPLSHAAFGRTLVALDGRHRLGAGATTAAVLGALCPDLDLARAFQGWDVYLLQHQSGTHCLIGALGCGILAGTVAKIKGSKDQEISGSKDRTIASWLRLVGAGTLGALSHVALDLVSGADLRLFAPVSDCIFTLPLFAMADPWLLAVLIVSAVIASFAGRRGALAGLLGVALMLAIKGAFYVRANEIERGAAGTGATHVEAVFGSWTRWTEIQIHPDTLQRWNVDAAGGRAATAAVIDRQLTRPVVARSRSLPTVANLLASHDDTFARVIGRPDGGYEVRWSALRYCRLGGDGSEPVCGLWFGGEYDPGGRPVAAIVRIGTIVQRRAVGRAAADDQ